jgi:hypothetical protein
MTLALRPNRPISRRYFMANPVRMNLAALTTLFNDSGLLFLGDIAAASEIGTARQ